jgi:hypothetical protein
MDSYNPYQPPVNAPGPMAPEASVGSVSFATIERLRETRPWLRFLSILAFISVGFSMIGGLMMLAASALTPPNSPLSPAAMAAMYIVMGLLYIPAALVMHRYANSIDACVANPTVVTLEAVVSNNKSFWKLMGIYAIGMIALGVLSCVGGMIAAVVMMPR